MPTAPQLATAIAMMVLQARTMLATTMIDAASLHHLLAWTSPNYPTGAFSYSQGLEWAVEAGTVGDEDTLFGFIEASVSRGSLWIDAVLFAAAWRATADERALDGIAALAAAWRLGPEAALESHQQGAAFLATVRAAHPHPMLDAFARRHADRPVAHSVALALACQVHAVPLLPALGAYLHAAGANLASAAIRLGVIGHTGGQRVISRLSRRIPALAAAASATDPDTAGTAAIAIDLCQIAHETHYTRLFRS
jgi:urease accessory protein